MRTSQITIRIQTMPPGGAPRWVRRQWIGLELPLVLPITMERHFSFRPNDDSNNNTDGYPVNTKDALRILRQKSPSAYQWFIKRLPALPQSQFIFAPSCCFVCKRSCR